MNRTNMTDIIKRKLDELLNKGYNNTDDLYGKISDELGIHRVVIRRVARELRNEYQEKINSLQRHSKNQTVSNK